MMKYKVKHHFESNQRTPATTTTTTTTTTTMHRVREAELFFLQGDFRAALKLTNNYLRGLPLQENETLLMVIAHRKLSTELNLKFDPSRLLRTITVRLNDSNPSLEDQAAAIALQSWYEISIKKKPTSPGHDHLQPFLTLYESRPMPLELMVIFIRFCQTQNEMAQAIGLTVEILSHRIMQHEPTDEKSSDDCYYNELVVHLLTSLIPFSQDPTLGRDILEGLFYQTSTMSSIDLSRWRGTHRPNEHTVKTALEMLGALPADENRFVWARQSIDQSKERLLALRYDVNDTNSNDINNSSTHDKTRQGESTPLPMIVSSQPRQYKWSTHRWIRLVQSYTRALYDDQNRWENRGKLAFSVAMILLAWRRKRRLALASKSIVSALISPLTELVEALAPTPARR
jgi:hypothetical protein